ncbi:MAG: NAD-dependent epimerase/dehydratase family protein, partial [bacterium]|nr:NAD-dependent epimerase/dehydratase family protein [bacterium]
MKPNLFITGAGGFLGKSLLAKLDPSKYGKIFCLTRKAESIRLPQWDSIPGHIEIIEGDLLDVSSYESFLKQSSCVIHMAAATGKADPKVYFKVNAYATMLLLDRCKNAGVEHFLFVSSIAVSFDNKFRYFYALSKEQAENYVISSGLKYTILRPTMIMGKGSPVFDGLAKLACLPVLPVFGDGKAPVQPIDVEDVAKTIRLIVDSNRFNNESLELGGPESLSIEEFMKKIAVARNKKEPAVFHLPLGLIVFFLSILERV